MKIFPSTTPQKNNNLGAPNTVWASFRNWNSVNWWINPWFLPTERCCLLGESYVFGYGRQNQTPDCENGRRSGTVFAVCGFKNFRVARSARIESTVLAERHATPDSRQVRVFHGGHVLRKTDRRFDKKRSFKPFLHRKRRFFRGKSVCGGRRASFKAFRTVPDRAENSSEYARWNERRRSRAAFETGNKVGFAIFSTRRKIDWIYHFFAAIWQKTAIK